MSLTGSTAFTSYDRTAKTSGAPEHLSPRHDLSIDPMEKESGHADGTTRTRSTSETEVEGHASHKHDDSKETEETELERRESIVQQLARRYTTQSTGGNPTGENPFLAAGEDSPLNPASPNFKAREWAKAIVGLDTAGFRSAGVCFQGLNVHGFGAATDYQKDVANVWLEAVGMARTLVGAGHKRKIDILRNFDGLVRKGEMLVVLGPPGSGCSTFLKTISGEHSGIYVDEKAYFNYQGSYKSQASHCMNCKCELLYCWVIWRLTCSRCLRRRNAHGSQG